VLQVALVLIIVVTLFGETLAPAMQAYATKMKIEARTGGQAVGTAHGLWLRNDSHFIYLGSVLSDQKVENVLEYDFDSNHQLKDALHADYALRQNGQWMLHNVKESLIKKSGVAQKVVPQEVFQVPLGRELVGTDRDFSANMPLWSLYNYIQLQKKIGMATQTLALGFWERIIQPFSALIMIFLAVPFVFGPLRSVTMGVRIVTGAAVGFSFYLLNQFFGPLSLVYQIPPFLGAVIPTILFALLGVWLMRRVR